MKTTTGKAIWSMCGLCLVLLVYACRNEDAEPLTPYAFNTLRDLQLTSAKLAAPIATTTTAATITPSPLASSVNTAIAGIQGSGSVPAVVTQAVTDINTALSAAGITPAALVSQFTPLVISTLTSQGTLPTGLQGTINTLTANPAIAPYLSAFTFPQINGQTINPATISFPGPAVGLVSPIISPVTIKPINQVGGDPCFKAANDLFDMKIQNIEADRLSQIASIDAAYAAEKTSAETSVPGCLSGKVSSYAALIATARQNLTTNISNLNAARILMGESAFQALTALVYVQYAQQIQLYYTMQASEINVCSIVSTVRIQSAQFTRDTNRNIINDGFNTTVKMAQALVLQAYNACHNQGSV